MITIVFTLAFLLGPFTGWALKLQTLDLKRHYRFYEGADNNFIGNPYDWSGVARTYDVGKWGAMISPSYFISANHFHPANGETFRFYHGNSTNDTYEERTVLSGQKILGPGGANSDLWLGKLSAPVSSAVAKYPMLRLPSTLNDYIGKKIHVFGRPTDNNQATNSQSRLHLGLSKVSSVQADSGGSYFSWYTSNAPFGGDTALYAEGGDSGGSSFIVFNGVPTVLGTHYYPNMSSFAPDYIDQFNAAMSASGEQVTVITLETTPAPPQNFEAGFADGAGARLQWSDIADTETGYELERRTADGAYGPLQALSANSASYEDLGAVPTVSYVYRLRAFNAVSTSEWVTASLERLGYASPYHESFENLAPGTLLPGFEGWSAADPGAAQVVDDSTLLDRLHAYRQPIGYPLRAEAHSQAAVFEGTVSNRVASVPDTAVWYDLMVDLRPMGGRMPSVPQDLQCAVALDSAGRLNVWHRDLVSGTNRWSVLDWQTSQTSQWARVTLHLDYATVDSAHNARYFSLFVDGAIQSNALAYTANDGTGAPEGTWFAMAGATADRMNALYFDGTGALDDLSVDTVRPLISLGPNGTPEWWLADQGLTNALSLAENEQADADSDDFANWKEYAAGTDPNGSASLLRFTEQSTVSNGRRAFVVQTVPGKNYTLEASSDLTAGVWQSAAFAVTPEGAPAVQTVTASAETLTFYVEPSGPNFFYRAQVGP
jgi:hypothetical protein